MERLMRKYIAKLEKSGLAEQGAPLMGVRDDEVIWSRSDPIRPVLERILDRLHIHALLFTPLSEPYRSIVDFLASRAEGAITPRDTETRTFFHALPVAAEFSPDAVAGALKNYKSVIIPGKGIVTSGAISPEQAFIAVNSVCFSCYVKFFSDYLSDFKRSRHGPNRIGKDQLSVFEKAATLISPEKEPLPALACGPFDSENAVLDAIEECGIRTVQFRLVDSYFGNISYLYDKVLFISQTSSSLDELRGAVDACPLDGSTCAAITASSEFSAHRQIVLNTGNRAVLHGHPKFPVIMSMDCEEENCTHKDSCFKDCPRERYVGGIPIVPGEVGTGPFGLCNTVPAAIQGNRGAIVYGHGVFTVGKADFNEAFRNMVEIEKLCREAYFEQVNG